MSSPYTIRTATAWTSNTVKNQTRYLQNILFFCTNYYMLKDISDSPIPIHHVGNSKYENNPHNTILAFQRYVKPYCTSHLPSGITDSQPAGTEKRNWLWQTWERGTWNGMVVGCFYKHHPDWQSDVPQDLYCLLLKTIHWSLFLVSTSNTRTLNPQTGKWA